MERDTDVQALRDYRFMLEGILQLLDEEGHRSLNPCNEGEREAYDYVLNLIEELWVDVDASIQNNPVERHWGQHKRKAVKKVEQKTVVCLDNTGMEDSFQIGVSYIFKQDKGNELIVVEDMNGCDKIVLRYRFGDIQTKIMETESEDLSEKE